MSFILDALKKSELERQRAATPGLVEAPTAQRRSRLPTWAWVVGALLLLNVGVLAGLLWRSQRAAAEPAHATAAPRLAARATSAARPAATPRAAEPPAVSVSGTVARSIEPAAAPDAADAAADHFSPMDAAPAGGPVYAPEIPVDEPPTRTANLAPRAVPPPAPTGVRATHRADPTLDETAADRLENDEPLPTISQVNLPGAPGLSDIHLDVHVYATRPADRFVYVNMRKYREGATLQEGPLLERIRRDGVILNYRGVRFLLPRQ